MKRPILHIRTKRSESVNMETEPAPPVEDPVEEPGDMGEEEPETPDGEPESQ